MRSGSEARPRIVFCRTALPALAVRKTLSSILMVLITGLLQLAPAHGQAMRTYTGVLSDIQLVNDGVGLSAAGTTSAAPATITIQKTLVSANRTAGIVSAGNSN